MKFSIFNIMDCHEDAGQNPLSQQQAAIEQCQIAESLGFYGYFIAEHHFTNYGVMPSPFVFLSGLSVITNKIMLGISVAVTPFHDPRRLSEDIAQLDLLSNGRVIVGLGSGFDIREFQGFGVPIEEKRDRFDENKKIIKSLLSMEYFESLPGNYNIGTNVALNIPTLSDLHERIYVSSAGTVGAYYVGRQNEKLMLSPFESVHSNFSALPEAIDNYKRGIEEISGTQNEEGVIVTLFCHVAESDEEARDNCMLAFDRYVSTRSPKPLEISHPGQFYNQYVNNGQTLIGSVNTVKSQLERINAAGVKHISLLFNFGGISKESIEKSMRLFSQEVM